MSLGAEIVGAQYSNAAWTTQAETRLGTKKIQALKSVLSGVLSLLQPRQEENKFHNTLDSMLLFFQPKAL